MVYTLQQLLYDDNARPIVINNNNERNEFLNAGISSQFDAVKISIDKPASGKSAGNDGLNAEFYKSTINFIAPILCRLFNKVLSTGVFPDS